MNSTIEEDLTVLQLFVIWAFEPKNERIRKTLAF